MSRRKYEPAGGVVNLRWRRGAPTPERSYGKLLLEVWRLEWSAIYPTGFRVFARLVAVHRQAVDGVPALCHLNGGKFELGSDERVQRYCSLGAMQAASMRVTLKDWPHD